MGRPPGGAGGAPGALVVRADLDALPLRRGALSGAWAVDAHVAGRHLPLVLAAVHGALAVGARADVHVPVRAPAAPDTAGDDTWRVPGVAPGRLHDVLSGAGFEVHDVEVADAVLRASATRARTLADTVGPGMRLLVCGLNPSVLSADVGVGFARPGNRYWPAAIAAGVASRPRDAVHALRHHGTGMTDVVKRATVAAAELTAPEYRAGVARVERLCRWLAPRAVCFVGLAGWRAAVDRRAVAGLQPEPFGGVPAYLMPSTSGLNAHSRAADLADHLRAAVAVADGR